MAKQGINYSAKINEMLDELPDFIREYIYNSGLTEKVATRFEYCRDIRDFLRFMVKFIPGHSGKSISEISVNDLAGITPSDINRYLTMLQGNGSDGLKPATVKRRRSTLSSMYSFYLTAGKMDRNPVLATKTIRLPERSLIYLSNDEQRLLLNTVRSGMNLSNKASGYHNRYTERDSALFLLILDTGLRVSEVLSTDIIDYDLETCSVVTVRKGGDIQNVYYSDECSEYLNTYFKSQIVKYASKDKKIPAFTTLKGERLGVRAVEKLVKKYVEACLPEKAGIISPHNLRSSFAMSFYAASGNNIILLQKKLNHKSILTTSIYARASETEMNESRSILQGLR